eukprot:1145191-Pelagomonas_calceolata.AAC.6
MHTHLYSRGTTPASVLATAWCPTLACMQPSCSNCCPSTPPPRPADQPSPAANADDLHSPSSTPRLALHSHASASGRTKRGGATGAQPWPPATWVAARGGEAVCCAAQPGGVAPFGVSTSTPPLLPSHVLSLAEASEATSAGTATGVVLLWGPNEAGIGCGWGAGG